MFTVLHGDDEAIQSISAKDLGRQHVVSSGLISTTGSHPISNVTTLQMLCVEVYICRVNVKPYIVTVDTRRLLLPAAALRRTSTKYV